MKTYWVWVIEQAEAINADGCSGPTLKVFNDTCYEHDLCYYWARDPRDAYQCYLDGHVNVWQLAKPISRGDADRLKAERLRERGAAGFVFSLWRYPALRLAGWRAWNKHRRREAMAKESSQ